MRKNNLFRMVFGKLKDHYNFMGKTYTRFVIKYPFSMIAFYVLVSISLSMGLFQANVIKDNESLFAVRNGQTNKDAQILRAKFDEDPHEHFFAHKLLNFGYYFEVIFKLRSQNDTLMNKMVLEEFNRFYDDIISTSIGPGLQYNEILCPRRLSKCSIEGSIARAPSFQRDLLAHKIDYAENDAKYLYMDAEAVDGSSLLFLLGTNFNKNCSEGKCRVTRANMFRIRFDLLSSNQTEIDNSLSFMQVFVERMTNATRDNTYPSFDFSFYTSHSLVQEVEKYSKLEIKYVIGAFVLFWFVFMLLMMIDVKLMRQFMEKNFQRLKRKHTPASNKDERNSSYANIFNSSSLWVRTPGYLVLVTFVQFFFTFLSALGFVSLLNIDITLMILSSVFIIMVTSCNQALLIFKSLTNKSFHLNRVSKRTEYLLITGRLNADNPELIANNDEQLVEIQLKSDLNANLKENFTQTVQQLIVPCFASTLTSVFGYLIIGIVVDFDSIRLYSLFLATSLAMNLFGLVGFFCPCLFLYVKRVKSNRNCLIPCIIHSSSEAKNAKNLARYLNTNEQIVFNSNNNQGMSVTTGNDNHNNSGKPMNDFRKRMLVAYLILTVFAAYLVFNAVIVLNNFRASLPVMSAIPDGSYVKKHMQYHFDYFELGPVVSLNFVRPLDYWNVSEQTRIRFLIDELHTKHGMTRLELSWLQDATSRISSYDMESECDNQVRVCFQLTLQDLQPQYKDDFTFADKPKLNDTDYPSKMSELLDKSRLVEITASRIYLQMSKFRGTMDEYNLMRYMKDLAKEKYKYDDDTLIVYSAVFGYLEQLGELVPNMMAIFLITIECLFFGSLVLLFDLRSIALLTLVQGSFLLSVVSNMFLFGYDLNQITLMHLLMVPAFSFEFFYYLAYVYLFNMTTNGRTRQTTTSKPSQNSPDTTNTNRTTSNLTNETVSSENSENTTSIDDIVNTESARQHDHKTPPNSRNRPSSSGYIFDARPKKDVHLAAENSANTSAVFVTCICLFSFSLLGLCETFNFFTLFLILMSVCFNLMLHLYFFYPVLLNLFGTLWQ